MTKTIILIPPPTKGERKQLKERPLKKKKMEKKRSLGFC
jgi:hypothetical protein